MFVFFILFIMTVVYPRSKILAMFWGVSLVVFSIVSISESPDVIALELRYTHRGFAEFPSLFKEIMLTCHDNNFTFLQFRFIAISIVAVIMLIIAFVGTKNSAICMMLISVYPGLCFGSQIRNTIGAAFVILAIVFLLKNQSKFMIFVLFISVIFAIMIHPSCIIYALIVYCLKEKSYISTKLIFGYVILIIFLYSGGLYKFLSIFIQEYRIIQYFEVNLTENMFGSIMATMGQIIITYLFVKQLKQAKRSNIVVKGLYANKAYELMIRIDILFLIIIPFYPISHAFFRIFKYLMIANYCLLCENIYKDGKNKNVNMIILIVVALVTLVGQLMVDNGIDGLFTLLDNTDMSLLLQVFGN